MFAFGEGLSYTTVEYADLVLDNSVVAPDGMVRATVRLTNSGSRPVLETVQAYVSDLATSATWAERELLIFSAAVSALILVSIPANACSLVNAAGRRVVEPGDFELRVGPSSVAARQLSARFSIRV